MSSLFSGMALLLGPTPTQTSSLLPHYDYISRICGRLLILYQNMQRTRAKSDLLREEGSELWKCPSRASSKQETGLHPWNEIQG